MNFTGHAARIWFFGASVDVLPSKDGVWQVPASYGNRFMLNLLRKSSARKQEGQRLYDGLVTRAREPVFFRDFRVADTIDGRFDMVVLHAWLALSALEGGGPQRGGPGPDRRHFCRFRRSHARAGCRRYGAEPQDEGLRGCLLRPSVRYGQSANEEELAAALARNLWRGAEVGEPARRLAAYAWQARESLKQGLPDRLDFGPLPQL